MLDAGWLVGCHWKLCVAKVNSYNRSIEIIGKLNVFVPESSWLSRMVRDAAFQGLTKLKLVWSSGSVHPLNALSFYLKNKLKKRLILKGVKAKYSREENFEASHLNSYLQYTKQQAKFKLKFSYLLRPTWILEQQSSLPWFSMHNRHEDKTSTIMKGCRKLENEKQARDKHAM